MICQFKKLPVRIGTNDQPVANAFLQKVIATFQWLYPEPKISDPDHQREKKSTL